MNDHSEEKSTVEKPIEEKKTPKYIFNCTKCGKCCEEREDVPVTTSDLKKWAENNILPVVMPYLNLSVTQQAIRVILKKENDEKGCPLYDAENKLCKIYMNMPDECNSFPLGFNGKSYYIKKFVECPGIGSGTMTKEQLLQDRKKAELDFNNQNEALVMTSIFYGIFIQYLQNEQKKAVKNMTEEEKNKYEELLKSREKDQTEN